MGNSMFAEEPNRVDPFFFISMLGLFFLEFGSSFFVLLRWVSGLGLLGCRAAPTLLLWGPKSETVALPGSVLFAGLEEEFNRRIFVGIGGK